MFFAWCVQRVLERPFAREQAFIGLFQDLGLEEVFRVDPLDQIEEEQERKLFGSALAGLMAIGRKGRSI